MKRKINDFITASSEEKTDVGELLIYGDIVDDKWYDEDVTLKDIVSALKDMEGIKTLEIHVNSYGGSVFAGNAIFNVIDTFKAKTKVSVVAYIDGIAASMGSNIPMVADKIIMYENSMMMLHKPLTFAYGNADDFATQIEILNQAEKTIITNYMRHFNGTDESLREILSANGGSGTWLTAREAMEHGLCSEIFEPVEMVASAKGLRINGVQHSTEVLNKIKDKYPKIKIKDESEVDEMKYDKKLLDCYNLSEEDFGKMKSADELIAFVCQDGVYTGLLEGHSIAISDEMTKEKFGGLTVNEVAGKLEEVETLSATVAGQKGIVEAYVKIKNATIEDAIKEGIRAKGDKFDEPKWRGRFENFELEEISDYKNEWGEEAEEKLNAGNRLSQPYAGGEPKDVSMEDYKF